MALSDPNVILNVLKHLEDDRDLANAARVCSAWREAQQDEQLWRHQLAARCRPLLAHLPRAASTQEEYKRLRRLQARELVGW